MASLINRAGNVPGAGGRHDEARDIGDIQRAVAVSSEARLTSARFRLLRLKGLRALLE